MVNENDKSVEIEKVFLQNMDFAQNIEVFKDVTFQFQTLMMMYNSAIREVRTKLEVLNDEFQVKSRRNPIEYIKYRVKKPQSIIEKLQRKQLPVSLDSVVNNLHDIAGIRVICSYVTDIYAIAEMLISQDDIVLITVKDYIKNPKPNGYRSLHLVVEIPVFFSDAKQAMKVEVQIRTIAMDFWASLEHQLHYKTAGQAPESIVTELKECAEVIAQTDSRMENIYKSLQEI